MFGAIGTGDAVDTGDIGDTADTGDTGGPVTIVAVSAGVGTPSSTRLLTDRLTAAATAAARGRGRQVSASTIELREYVHDLADATLLGYPNDRLGTAVEQVVAADGLVAVTPVFSASYSGLFKSFFDVLEPGALTGKPVLLGATAGSARHSLALEHALRPLFSYLGMLTTPTGVFAAATDWADSGLDERVTRAARQFVDLLAGQQAVVAADENAPIMDGPFGGTREFASLLDRR